MSVVSDMTMIEMVGQRGGRFVVVSIFFSPGATMTGQSLRPSPRVSRVATL